MDSNITTKVVCVLVTPQTLRYGAESRTNKMTGEQLEELLNKLLSASNMLIGMQFDPAIPEHAKYAMKDKILEIENTIGKYIY